MPAQYLWPLLLLIGACFSCIFTLLLYTTETEDRFQRHREEQALESVLDTASAMVRHDLQDYAKWNDGVRHIGIRLEPDWIDDNVSAYLGTAQGYSAIFVLDENGRTAYRFGRHASGTASAETLLGPDFAQSIRAVREMPTDGNPIVSGFTRAGRRVFIYSTAAVVPLTEKVRLPSGPTKLIVIAQEVDGALLKDLTDKLDLRGVRLALDGYPHSQEALPVRGARGKPIAWVEWTAHQPGAALRRQMIPPILILALIAFLAAGLILRRGGRAIEDLQQSELRARHLSDHDPLTGLPNRRALGSRIRELGGSGAAISLLFLDLDGFKAANDVYGHSLGDQLLNQAASRIRSAAGRAFVARTGGDEFALLISPASAGTAQELANDILAQFQEPLDSGEHHVKLGVSIGFVEAGSASEMDPVELMRRADVAMYAAKAAGKRCARAYEAFLDDGYDTRIRLENDLRTAVAREEIRVCYQPIVDAQTGDVVAVEALARWSHPDHGDVPPDVFIAIAEVSGLISIIGRQVLFQACGAMRDVGIDLAVNLSPAQLWDEGLVGTVKTVLEATGFPPQRLELEITENLLLRNPDVAARIIDSLRSLGIRIALDDFGTGFASIGYLQQLKLDRLKIDKAFIAPLETDGKARQMLVSIAGLAKACDLEVCAEGIETAGQARIALEAGCSRLQGWHFGRPSPAEVILAGTASGSSASMARLRVA